MASTGNFGSNGPAMPGMWSPAQGNQPNNGLGGGHGLGNINTSTSAPDTRLGGYPTGGTDTYEQDQMKPEEESNSSITVAYAIDNTRPRATRMITTTSRAQLSFIKVFPDNTRRVYNIPGPHSAAQEQFTLSELNLYLSSTEGIYEYPGRNCKKIRGDWRIAGVEKLDHTGQSKGSRTYDFGKKTLMMDYWGCDQSRDLREGDSMWLVLTKRTRDGSALPSILGSIHEENKRRDRVGARAGGRMEPGSAESMIFQVASAYSIMDSDKSAAANPTEKDEYWVFVPVTTDHGCTPDTRLYNGGDVMGDCIHIGDLHHFESVTGLNRAALCELACAATYPKDMSMASREALVALPTIEVNLRCR
jgi:hypothetical protein